MDFLHYGLQRSGTNYLKDLVLKNFNGVVCRNDPHCRSLPLQKHFRLYDEKHFIPTGAPYYNNFHYTSFEEFDQHVLELTGVSDMRYIVIVRDPFSWYLSVRKEAKKMKWLTYIGTNVNPNFMIDWNLFYRKWLHFQKEEPDRVLFLNYEDLLLDFHKSMERVEAHLDAERKDETFQDVSKVFKSKKYTEERKDHLREKRYLKEYEPRNLFLLAQHLDRGLMDALNYEFPAVGLESEKEG